MDLKFNSQTTFGYKLSEDLERQLYKEVRRKDVSQKKLNKLLNQKITEVEKWGSPDSEIVFAKHPQTGSLRLGLRADCGNNIRARILINGLSGKNYLSQFLGLTQEKVLAAEVDIKTLYKKHGLSIFKHFMI